MAAFAEKLLSSELFGHVANWFNNAEERIGVFELCHDRGLIVLDEFLAGMESLQRTLQPMLLRVLEEASVVKMGDGSRTQKKLKSFILATTNEFPTLRELDQAIIEKRVRGDLVARFPNRYELLPISSRPLEILPSFLWSLKKSSTEGQEQSVNLVTSKFTVDALKLLLQFNYPENFRQLQHAANQIARSPIYKATEIITKELVLNALMIRSAVSSEETKSVRDITATAQGEATDGDVARPVHVLGPIVEVELRWGEYQKQDRNSSNPLQFQKVSKWPKTSGDTERTYASFLDKIIIRKVHQNKLKKPGAKEEKRAELFMAELANLNESLPDNKLSPVLRVLSDYLSEKKREGESSAVKQEFREWIRNVHDDLAKAFPQNEERGKQVSLLTEGMDELQRAMMVWLLSGCRITATEFVDILDLQEKVPAKMEKANQEAIVRNDDDVGN